jgi:hypothetical protein
MAIDDNLFGYGPGGHMPKMPLTRGHDKAPSQHLYGFVLSYLKSPHVLYLWFPPLFFFRVALSSGHLFSHVYWLYFFPVMREDQIHCIHFSLYAVIHVLYALYRHDFLYSPNPLSNLYTL